MADTIQKYHDYVMTGFMKSVVPIVVERASGAMVTDVTGREYLDCFAGISVVNSGHNSAQVLAAAKAQNGKTGPLRVVSLSCAAGRGPGGEDRAHCSSRPDQDLLR